MLGRRRLLLCSSSPLTVRRTRPYRKSVNAASNLRIKWYEFFVEQSSIPGSRLRTRSRHRNSHQLWPILSTFPCDGSSPVWCLQPDLRIKGSSSSRTVSLLTSVHFSMRQLTSSTDGVVENGPVALKVQRTSWHLLSGVSRLEKTLTWCRAVRTCQST